MSLVTLDHSGLSVAFRDDGWINAKQAAAHCGKRVGYWLAHKATQECVGTLCEITNTRKRRQRRNVAAPQADRAVRTLADGTKPYGSGLRCERQG